MPSGYPLSFVPGHMAPEDPGEAPLCFAFRNRDLLVMEDGALPPVALIDEHGIEAVRRQYLGSLNGTHCYSLELAPDIAPPPGMDFRNLRMLFGSLDPACHAVAGRAVQIVEWDRTHQFCGSCGQKTVLADIDRSRSCPDCAVPMYPRLSPAMIVAVERGDQVLLGRSPHFPPGIYSCLAGFVEPGESAEEAVIREVYEETRIVCDNVRYFNSQAWPFPNSLMLGFTAQYVGGEIDTRGDELEDARWCAADDMPNIFPGNVSISQWLLADFLERNQGG
ncbi:MAG: NAD(+) diphosphatase [Myxococcales bacterium]|nr:NAD(+) diphosphatase [Myxococcales bacterium]